MRPRPVSAYVITDHARLEMERRSVTVEQVRGVLAAPQQTEQVRPGRLALQNRIVLAGREYVIRVFVDTDRSPAEVVTAYRTSKVAKYWRQSP